MHFTFLPSFLKFFKTYNHLPSQITYKYLKYSNKQIVRTFISMFTKRGNNFKFMAVVLNLLCTIGFNFSKPTHLLLWNNLNGVSLDVDIFSKIIQIFKRLKFIFFFFFYKLNKLIYKYSNYKRPRYSLEFRYVPTYKRFKELFKYMRKSVVYYKGKTFLHKFRLLFLDLLLNPKNLQFVQFTIALQGHLFTNKKHLLYYK